MTEPTIVICEVAKLELLAIEGNRVRIVWNNQTMWFEIGVTLTLTLPVTLSGVKR